MQISQTRAYPALQVGWTQPTMFEDNWDDVYELLRPYGTELVEGAHRVIARLEESPVIRSGLLFPVMLEQICAVPAKDAARLRTAWKALYLYSMHLDHQMDADCKTHPSEQIAATGLFLRAIRELRLAVAGTIYEDLLESHLMRAVSGQAKDYSFRINPPLNASEVSGATIDKNFHLVALAVAYAAKGDNGGDKAIAFTEAIIPAVQYLDDITDVESDLLCDATSYLIYKSRTNHQVTCDITESMKRLLSSNALIDVMREAKSAVELAILQIDTKDFRPEPHGPLRLACNMRAAIEAAMQDVQRLQKHLSNGSPFSVIEVELRQVFRQLAFSS